MKLSGVGARVLVEDFQECFDFYKDVLGYEVGWGDRNGEYASFSVPGEDSPAFAIFKKENMSLYEGYLDIGNKSKSDSVQLCIGSDDTDEVYQQLTDRGVQFIGQPRNMPEWYMRCVLFRDPEDNLIELSGPIREDE